MAMEFQVNADRWTEEFASRYLQLVASQRTEQEVGLTQLKDAGIPPDPPVDWNFWPDVLGQI